MNFCSDNVAGAAPEILEALAAGAAGTAMPYGDDPVTRRLAARLAELFEHPVEVFPVATGTAANALALSVLTPPYGAIYCHRDSHIEADECGAPEFYTGGARLVLLDGPHGRLHPADLAARLERGGAGIVHHVQPAALSLTQATEAGTLYTPEAVAALAAVARRHGLAVHMDGARFANAVAALGCAPAEPRRDQERLPRGGGGAAVQAGAGPGAGLPAQARGTSAVEDAVPVAAARCLAEG